MNPAAYLRPLPKAKVQEPVPVPLLVFLRDVNARIEASDKEAIVPSDDLLQSDQACGGLLRGERSLYSFTYFPTIGAHSTWVLRLTAEEIGDVAWGVTERLELWSCRDPNCTRRFASADATCVDCDWVRGEAAASLIPEEIEQAEQLRLDLLHKHKQDFLSSVSQDPILQRKLDRFRTIIDEQAAPSDGDEPSN